MPGPGNYKLSSSIDKSGVYFDNRYKNSGAPIFSKASRLNKFANPLYSSETPGPGTYRAVSEFGYGEVS